MDLIMKYAQYIDDIRVQKNMTTKELCDGIVNERTFRRYLSGERNISQEKVFLFCQRLEISPTTFFNSFLSQDKNEYTKLHRLYTMLHLKEFDDFEKGFSEISRKHLLSKMHLKLYDYLAVRYLKDTNSISLKEAYKRLSEVIDFPKCINNNVFDFADILTLFSLSNTESKERTLGYKGTTLLKRILLDETIRYLDGDNKLIMYGIYAAVSVAYSEMGNFEECLELSKQGIEYCLRYGNNMNLTSLYYVHGKSLMHFGREEEAKLSLVKCLANTITLQNFGQFEFFTNLLHKNFNLGPNELFQNVSKVYLKN